MSEQPIRPPCCLGLRARVRGQRRTTHNKYVPGPKTGDLSYLAEVKLFQRSKIPPYAAISLDKKARYMVVDFQNSALQPFSEPETRQASPDGVSLSYHGLRVAVSWKLKYSG